ncbi:cell wall-binding repeat-containing protein [Streptomyces sp. CB01881]|uniref:cell wall-binding repeat-containing protein n=1 Tax=Streptomyces sp. CB01881 TaxID=2078691 RepID=UPI001386BC48|nr:cell wall-binding repeat-containing protein [Streptomyces sp. CB01881]
MALTQEDRVEVSRIGSAAAGGRALAYRAHVRNLGWSPWVGSTSEQFAGWTGRSEPIEAVEFAWASAPADALLEVRAHWSGIGWQGYGRVPSVQSGGKLLVGEVGAAGPSLEALTFGGSNSNYYRSDGHVQSVGWQRLDNRGVVRQEIGTTGKNLWMEAFRIMPFAASTKPVDVARVSGASAAETSVNASRKYWRSKEAASGNAAESAVVARFDAWHDAVSAIPLAKAKRGPLLLNPKDGLDGAVAAELKRVLPVGRTVYLPGGFGSISEATVSSWASISFAVCWRCSVGRAVSLALVSSSQSTSSASTCLPFRAVVSRSGSRAAHWVESPGAFQSPGDHVSPQAAAARGVLAGPSRTHRSSG